MDDPPQGGFPPGAIIPGHGMFTPEILSKMKRAVLPKPPASSRPKPAINLKPKIVMFSKPLFLNRYESIVTADERGAKPKSTCVETIDDVQIRD